MRRFLILLSALTASFVLSAQSYAAHHHDHCKHKNCVRHYGVWLCGKKNKVHHHCKHHGKYWHCTR